MVRVKKRPVPELARPRGSGLEDEMEDEEEEEDEEDTDEEDGDNGDEEDGAATGGDGSRLSAAAAGRGRNYHHDIVEVSAEDVYVKLDCQTSET